MHYHLSIKTTTHAMFGIIVSLFISCNLNQHILNRDEDNDRTMANIKGEYCIVILHRKFCNKWESETRPANVPWLKLQCSNKGPDVRGAGHQ